VVLVVDVFVSVVLVAGATTSTDDDAWAPVARFATETLYVPSGAFPAAFENVYVPVPSDPADSG
jgi:hypothetical protein